METCGIGPFSSVHLSVAFAVLTRPVAGLCHAGSADNRRTQPVLSDKRVRCAAKLSYDPATIGEHADMKMAIFRRPLILAVGFAGVLWAAGVHAESRSFKVSLSGAQEAPPVETAGSGTADLTYDPATRVVTWTISYGGLSGPATMAHFHGPGAVPGKAVVMVWLSKQGSAAESPIKGEATLTPEQAQQFTAGEWYINVHTQAHPAGEIRGRVPPPTG
jgi:hypothetical protein